MSKKQKVSDLKRVQQLHAELRDANKRLKVTTLKLEQAYLVEEELRADVRFLRKHIAEEGRGNLFQVIGQMQSIGRLISFSGVDEPYEQPANQCVAVAPSDNDATMVVRVLKAVAIAYHDWLERQPRRKAVLL